MGQWGRQGRVGGVGGGAMGKARQGGRSRRWGNGQGRVGGE